MGDMNAKIGKNGEESIIENILIANIFFQLSKQRLYTRSSAVHA